MPLTEEHKRKISLANKGKKKPPFSEEHKKKLSLAHLGKIGYWKNKKRIGWIHPMLNKHHSLEAKEKMSKSLVGRKVWNKGLKGWNKGHLVSEETRIKISIAISGNKNVNWRGGISFEPYPINWTEILRKSIRDRDGYVCQICGIHQNELKGFQKKLSVHHIDYNKNNLNPENLITLCCNCHHKTSRNRNKWEKYFTKKD